MVKRREIVVVACRYKYHCDELVPRVLVDDVSSFPEGWVEALVLIFRKISELHGKMYPLSNLNMHFAKFPQIVGITKEQIMAIIWEMLSKKGDQHLEQFQCLNTTYIIAFH